MQSSMKSAHYVYYTIQYTLYCTEQCTELYTQYSTCCTAQSSGLNCTMYSTVSVLNCRVYTYSTVLHSAVHSTVHFQYCTPQGSTSQSNNPCHHSTVTDLA